MKTFFVSILILGFAFCNYAQDDKKVPEKKLSSGETKVTYDPAKKPERKLIKKADVQKTKDGQVNGTPEKKLVEKKK